MSTARAGRRLEARHTPADEEPSQPTGAEHWSPLSTTQAKWSWGLLAIFAAIYFVIAVLTSEAAADLAATMIMGLPLGFYLGVAMIISGLVIVRFYLARVER